MTLCHLRDANPKKRDFLGIYPKGGGGSSQFPKLLQINQVVLVCQIILSCQNMFYNSGEVISDQINHLILIQNLENKPYFFLETGVLKRGRGGSVIWEKFPKSSFLLDSAP